MSARTRPAAAARHARGTVNELEIRLVGLSRSGNHAVAGWILSGSAGRTCFLNCCEGRSNPFETARPLASGDVALSNIPSFSLDSERCARFSRKDLLLFTHEDSYLARGAFGDCPALAPWFEHVPVGARAARPTPTIDAAAGERPSSCAARYGSYGVSFTRPA